MSEANTQNLPAGLAGRAAAASTEVPAVPTAAAPAVPQAPAAPTVGGPSAVDRVPVPEHLQRAPAVEAAAPAPAVAAPVVPTLPKVEAPAPTAPPGTADTVAAMAGALANDPQLAPAVNYLDMFCKEQGVDMARAFGNAAAESDARFIDRAYLKEKLGDKADQVIKTAEGVLNYAVAYGEQTVAEVHKLAGGESGWGVAAQSFNTHATPEDRAIVAKMLESGDRTQVLYAARQVLQYATQAGGAIQHHAPQLGTPGAAKGLSHAEYIKAIQERNVSPEKYAQLKQARLLGRSQGL